MNQFLRNSLSVLAVSLVVSLTSSAASAQEPARQGANDSALESLRAGAVNDSGLVLAATDRDVLAAAAAAAPVLETLRATDMNFSDHELEIILVTVAVVVLLVVLL